MDIVTLSDIHGHIQHIASLAGDLRGADVVVLSGDLTNFGEADDAAKILDAVRQYNTQIVAVPGNCDFPSINDYLLNEGVSVHRRHRIIDDVAFAGIGASLPCPITTPNEASEDELAQWLADAVEGLDRHQPLILIAHQPPLDTSCDYAAIGKHVGSASVRAFIEARQPLICYTGHIHEAKSMDRVGATHIVNSGALAQRGYAHTVIGDGVELVEIRGF